MSFAVHERGDEVASRWHERFGHVNMEALRKLAREELMCGLPDIGKVDQLSEACLVGKQRRAPFLVKAEYRAKRRLELVHGDLCGPITPPTPSDNKYFLLFVDNLSRFMWVAKIPSKDRATAVIKELQTRTVGESELKLGGLWTDQGGEFTSIEFAEYCVGEGIHRQHTAPYSPQHNGVVERRNGTVVSKARSMLNVKRSPSWKKAKILENSDLAECNPCHLSMEPRLKLSKLSTKPPVDASVYRSIVGSLRYLVNTHPDLAFAVGYVSRFMEDPRENHLTAVKCIMRYVAGTQGWGFWFSRKEKEEPCLTGFSDSDYAGDVDTSKSTTGVIFFLSGSPITWQSMKQKVVTQSSCEAEYITTANTASQALWLARVLVEVQGTTLKAPMPRVDNKSAIALIKNPVLHGQSRHIRVQYHFVWETAEGGLIDVEFIISEDQLRHILTKALGKSKFHELRGKIGLIDINCGHKA